MSETLLPWILGSRIAFGAGETGTAGLSMTMACGMDEVYLEVLQ